MLIDFSLLHVRLTITEIWSNIYVFQVTSHCVPIKYFNKYHIGRCYRQTSNTSRTLVGNKIVDHSDVAGASPVGAAPYSSSFSTQQLASMDWTQTTAKTRR